MSLTGHSAWSRAAAAAATFLVLVAPHPALAQGAPAAPARPNIVWISAEDLSPDLGSYGDGYAATPTLDQLAREGARFTHVFSSAPVCAPSRSAIITGMYPTTIGSMHMRSKAVPPAGVRAFTEYLRAAGYYCTNRSKTDYNFEAPPSNRPPDTVWDESSEKAHWRNRPDPRQPFFAVFNITTTHEGQIRLDEAAFAKVTAPLEASMRHDPSRAVLPPYYPDTPLVRRDWARYYDLITVMDGQVKAILRQLEDDGLADGTVVFFWGDHGRGLPRAKRFTYDSGLRVPLIVRWPGAVAPGSVVGDLVSLMDLGPTVLALAGVPIPEHMQGQPFLGPGKPAARRFVLGHRDRMDEAYDMMRTVRDTRYRYIRNFYPGRPYAQHIEYMEEMPTMREWRRRYKDHMNAVGPEYGTALNPVQLLFMAPEKPAEELYDLDTDPYEIRNLAGSPEHQSVLARMRQTLEAWQQETGDLGLVPEAALRERMRPGGVWVKVAAPTVNEVRPRAGVVRLTLRSDTPGASFAYTTEPGSSARWKLSTGAIELATPVAIRIKACRLGYLDSEEVAREYR
jgi:N-sulfoglucosamine sulfohydrolase